MPTRIKVMDGHMLPAEDPFTWVADDQDLVQGDVILSLARFQTEGDRLLSEGHEPRLRVLGNDAWPSSGFLGRLSPFRSMGDPRGGDRGGSASRDGPEEPSRRGVTEKGAHRSGLPPFLWPLRLPSDATVSCPCQTLAGTPWKKAREGFGLRDSCAGR